MRDLLLKNYSIRIEQKLYEKETPNGMLAVYQTSPFGMMLTLDGRVVLSQHDGFFFHEMMAHPALFTHPHPEKVVIIGNGFGTLAEVLKHPSVKQVICIGNNTHLDEAVSQYFSHLQEAKRDPRVVYHVAEPITWLAQCEPKLVDIIIENQFSNTFLQSHYQYYHRVLRQEGMLVVPCQSSLLELNSLKPIFQNILQAGFHDRQILNFPQPSHTLGSRIIMMAAKNAPFKRIREKDIYNRSFTTRYYNFDTHKAALALPEFMKEEI